MQYVEEEFFCYFFPEEHPRWQAPHKADRRAATNEMIYECAPFSLSSPDINNNSHNNICMKNLNWNNTLSNNTFSKIGNICKIFSDSKRWIKQTTIIVSSLPPWLLLLLCRCTGLCIYGQLMLCYSSKIILSSAFLLKCAFLDQYMVEM